MSERTQSAVSQERTRTRPEKETAGERCCPECDGSLVQDESRGEIHCGDCGRVIEADRIDHAPEWRAYSAAEQQQKARTGPPRTEHLHDRGLSTLISWKDRDGYGKPLSDRKRSQFHRLRTWDERFRTKDGKERNLKQALGELNRMASALGLVDPIRETAIMLYRRALDEDMLRGRSIEGMATAALYAATRIEGAARSLDEVANVSRVEKLEIERSYRYLVDELDVPIPPTDPETFIARFASKLELTDETERQARALVHAAIEAEIHSGRNPVGIAAASLYAAGTLTEERLVQSDVAEVSDVSEVTIRNRYREILDAAE